MTYYVIASLDHGSHRLCYETGTTTIYGNIYMGDVLEAKRFESIEEVCKYITNKSGRFDLGCSIVSIADVTFDKIKENKELYIKFHDPLYVLH